MIFYYGLFFYNHLTITIFIKHYFNKMNGIKRTMWFSEFISVPSCCLTELTMFDRFIKDFMVPFLKKKYYLIMGFY